MAELADAHDSGSCGESRAGSSPVIRTTIGASFACSDFFVRQLSLSLFRRLADTGYGVQAARVADIRQALRHHAH